MIKRFINTYKVPEEGKKLPGKTLTLRVALAFIAVFLCLVFIATSAYALFEKTVTSTGNTITASNPSTTTYSYTFNNNSDTLKHADEYLYRVGNGNTVTLGTLFGVTATSNSKGGSGAKAGDPQPDPANVKIKVESVDANASVTGSGTNLESDSNAKCVYTRNASDWTASTLKFTGEGPVRVTISEGNGTTHTLNLEVVTGNNYTGGATLGGSANIVLLGNVKIGGSSGTNAALSLNGKNLYGNGFIIDVTGSNISTKGHCIISLTNSSIDNAIIIGPTFTEYQGTYNNDYFGSTVSTEGGVSYITNCRITGASSPLRIRSAAEVKDTILSGGMLANMEIRSGQVTVENLTTVNTQNSLSILFGPSCAPGSSITINGTFEQHNFISQNVSMSNTYANTLKTAMFGSSYSKYQFESGGTKYVNTGIVSMLGDIGADNIIDNRSDKKNYSGATASLLGQTGYVYTMENTDLSMLETSYTEPEYTPSTQKPYEPVFSWAVPSGDNVAAGGDAHCYQDSSGVLQIQFLSGGSKTINSTNYQTFKKYQGATAIAPTSITYVKNVSGDPVTVTGGNITFTEAGEYTISYHYDGVTVYDKDLGTTTKVNYTKTIKVNIATKKLAPNAVITVSQVNGTMIWGGAGSSFDRDYQPAAPIFDNMTITDYNDDGTAYTVLDGDNQAAFLNNIASVVADSDNKTGFTINFPDGTKLVIKCGAPYNSGTLQFKKYNNKFLMCGSVAYNNPGASTWYVNSYTYTGRNGVAVTYGKRGFTSTTDSTYYTLSNLSTNKFLMYDAQGGTVSPTYVALNSSGSTSVTLPQPTREGGYTFSNWNTKSDGTGTARNAGQSYSFNSTTTLYAIWAKNVTVSFSSSDSIVDTISEGYGTTQTLPTVTDEFNWLEGWYTEESGGTKIGNPGASFTVPTEDTTYYAHWSPKYYVIYNTDGGTVSAQSVTDPSTGQTVYGAIYEGTAITLPTTATKSGFTFDGWYTAASGGTKVTGSYTPTDNTILYAHWKTNWVVTYNANGGTVNPASAEYTYSGALTLPTPTNGAKTFEGWYTAADGGALIGQKGDSYTPTANIELFAHWSDNILVEFDYNGGTTGISSATYDNVTPITLPSTSWAGHQFNGWYDAASGGTKVGNAGASYVPTAPVTLYAQWTAYTVSFDGNGVANPSALSAGSDGSVTLPTPTRTGYTFNGWYTATSGGSKIGNGGASYTPTANITVHAQWAINSYKVTITTSNSTTTVTNNATGATISSGGSVAYDTVVKVVLSYSQSNSLTFTIKQGNSNVTYYSNEACTSSTTSTAAGTYYFKMPAGDVTINSSSASGGGGTCITEGTLITLADGSQKPVEELTGEELLLVWNLETGSYDAAPIMFIDSDPEAEYTVIHTCFSDGTDVEVVSEHGFFDLDLGKYVYISEETLTDYIGHRFVTQGGAFTGDWGVVTLTDVWTETQTVKVYSPVTFAQLCYYTDGMLSMPGGISGLFNIFDVDTERMIYDEAKMAADIAEYGLLTLDDYGGMINDVAFEAFNGKWLGIAIGKGNLTWEYVAYLAERYGVFW